MARIALIVVDARRPLRLARFWSAFQRGESPVRPGRLHIDIVGGIRADEVARLQALGATVRDVHEHHTVMLDPEGNRFCVQDPHG